MKDIKYSLDDITIVPAELSYIKSRSECNPYYKDGKLPLFTAPMNTVVDEQNYNLFENNGINSIIPRTVDINKRIEILERCNEWVAFGLQEIEKLFTNSINYQDRSYKILIDIANGHMSYLYEIVDKLKEKYPNCILMVGNIANPDTYKICCKHEVDYVRVGIGGGSGCLTTSNTGIHYSMSSLIEEIVKIKNNDLYKFVRAYGYQNRNNIYSKTVYSIMDFTETDFLESYSKLEEIKFRTKIVADGGMKNYSDIIKALALGADYVMCGDIFAKMLETPGEVKYFSNNTCNRIINQYDFDFKSITKCETLQKQFYGMSTKAIQKSLNKEKLKTSEGIIKTIDVKYTMGQWVENFISYLKSCMSYTGKRTLEEFVGNVKIITLSENASKSFNK